MISPRRAPRTLILQLYTSVIKTECSVDCLQSKYLCNTELCPAIKSERNISLYESKQIRVSIEWKIEALTQNGVKSRAVLHNASALRIRLCVTRILGLISYTRNNFFTIAKGWKGGGGSIAVTTNLPKRKFCLCSSYLFCYYDLFSFEHSLVFCSFFGMKIQF